MEHKGLRVRPRDWLWAGVALVVVIGGLRYVVSLVAAVRDGDLGALVLGGLFVVALCWIILGAWRRTVWGAPPGGLRDQGELRARSRGGDIDPVEE